MSLVNLLNRGKAPGKPSSHISKAKKNKLRRLID